MNDSIDNTNGLAIIKKYFYFNNQDVKSYFCYFFLTSGIFSSSANLQTALQQLNTQTQFVDFDLGLTAAEKQQIIAIKTKPHKCYDNYGDLKTLVVDLTIYFETLGNDYNSSYKAAKAIHRIVKKMKEDLKAESFWLTMRLPDKSDMYDIPRWHIDGFYYPPFKGRVTKIVFTLKGPSTLFYNILPEKRGTYNEISYRPAKDKSDYSYGNTMEGRKELAKLVDHAKVHQPSLQTGTVYLVGDTDTAAIHSEPPIHEDRIFVSILPGAKEQIQYWQGQHNNHPKTTSLP